MRFLPTRLHGVVDYLAGIVFIVVPWLFDWPSDAAWVSTVLGVLALVYSLLTNYELGVARVISMSTHLLLDLASGVVFIVAPFLLDPGPGVTTTMVIFGLAEIGASLVTRRTPEAPAAVVR